MTSQGQCLNSDLASSSFCSKANYQIKDESVNSKLHDYDLISPNNVIVIMIMIVIHPFFTIIVRCVASSN